jgi:hypothetical protein
MLDDNTLEIRKGFNLLAAAILRSVGGGNGDALTPESAVRMVDKLRQQMGDL